MIYNCCADGRVYLYFSGSCKSDQELLQVELQQQCQAKSRQCQRKFNVHVYSQKAKKTLNGMCIIVKDINLEGMIENYGICRINADAN